MADELPKNGRSDHDLLIELATKMERVSIDIRDLGKDITESNTKLSNTKLDKEDFNKWDRSFCRDYERDMSDLKKLVEVNVKDHEKRIRRLEQWGFIAIGALAVLQIILAAAK